MSYVGSASSGSNTSLVKFTKLTKLTEIPELLEYTKLSELAESAELAGLAELAEFAQLTKLVHRPNTCCNRHVWIITPKPKKAHQDILKYFETLNFVKYSLFYNWKLHLKPDGQKKKFKKMHHDKIHIF